MLKKLKNVMQKKHTTKICKKIWVDVRIKSKRGDPVGGGGCVICTYTSIRLYILLHVIIKLLRHKRIAVTCRNVQSSIIKLFSSVLSSYNVPGTHYRLACLFFLCTTGAHGLLLIICWMFVCHFLKM